MLSPNLQFLESCGQKWLSASSLTIARTRVVRLLRCHSLHGKCIVCYLTDLINNYKHIFFRRVPFDWRNPCGYMVVFIASYAVAFYSFYCAFVTLSIILKTLWNLVSLAKDLKISLVNISSAKKNRLVVLKDFNGFIKFHMDVKQLSKFWSPCYKFSRLFKWFIYRLIQDFYEIYKFLIMSQFVWTILSICITLLQFKAEMVINIFFSIISISKKWVVLNLIFFLNCSQTIQSIQLCYWLLAFYCFGLMLFCLSFASLVKEWPVNLRNWTMHLCKKIGFYIHLSCNEDYPLLLLLFNSQLYFKDLEVAFIHGSVLKK